MGNCFASNKINKVAAQEEVLDDHPANPVNTTGNENSAPSENKKKTTVTFKLGEEMQGDQSLKNGVVRVRVVVTREELKQIMLNWKKDSDSLEKLKRALRSRARRVSDIRTEHRHETRGGTWRPELESIPEEILSH